MTAPSIRATRRKVQIEPPWTCLAHQLIYRPLTVRSNHLEKNGGRLIQASVMKRKRFPSSLDDESLESSHKDHNDDANFHRVMLPF